VKGRGQGKGKGKGMPRKEQEEKTGQDRTGQDRTGQDRTGQDRTGQDRTGQDRTEQDRTGQDRTGSKEQGKLVEPTESGQARKCYYYLPRSLARLLICLPGLTPDTIPPSRKAALNPDMRNIPPQQQHNLISLLHTRIHTHSHGSR
jgi:hypothetical protein